MMKLIVGLIVFIAFLLSIGALILLGKQERADQLRWEEFTEIHHCHLKSESFWAQPLWNCDGFEIRH